ncbi:exopolysaccharide biosynthesis polyprenyl glycosylphosphotransferase [Paenibacillus shirakamiensis]|uniref:Exopolysaccharide biosynthesis polyprenyl glycosylphosphotransferase n=1 Tax=Paenibacillus shirakamiensis TaxID=1265935 RepID=A0ABS4JMV8_9BACL|nr:sugar transferase [Paenibacillus shirakamiensis]MBP2001944.1 exopolysaccharide biosynthesis polyprenyl glycosylphosphotransferase [Paenibacillus shirakamiensis]
MIKLFRLRGWKAAVLLLDCLFVYSSYYAAYRIYFQGLIPAQEWSSFLEDGPWLGILTVITYYLFCLYDFAGRRKPAVFFQNLILAHVAFVAELIFLNYWLRIFMLPRSVVLIAFGLQLALTFGLRLLMFYVQSRGLGRKKAIFILGGNEPDLRMLEPFREQGKGWFTIQRILTLAGQTWQSTIPEDEKLDVVILSPSLSATEKTDILYWAGRRGMEVLLIPDFYELSLANAEPQQVADLLVYSIMPPHLTLLERIMKRMLDLAISSLLLLVTSPLLFFMWICIPLTSKGKALFYQERIGLHGKPFRVMKFRSMIDQAELKTGPILASAKDTRVTRLGQFIRTTRLDELPQLFNVLTGHMSLVGPRPEREFFINQFQMELPHYAYRLMVKPGLTGLAQVKAGYATSAADKLRYDLMYINNYSPLLDLRILFQTIMVVLSRESSRGLQSSAKTNSVEMEQM